MNPQKIMDVFAIPETTKTTSIPWPKIGVAFLNKDNSINVVLDLFPRVGKIHIRPRKLQPQKERSK